MTGILIINKPGGWTSHDVVAKLRGVLREKRIGHGGTLDPMATGVLPVFIGRATRAVEFLENADKEYSALLRLGVSTDTQDITGKALRHCDAEITRSELLAALDKFRGEIKQLPPMYSAVKINGRKLYQYARSGTEVERRERSINISKLELEGKEGEDWRLKVVCSKGTYIRTLCSDIGDSLGCGGTLAALTRVRAGTYSIEQAHTLEETADFAVSGEIDKILLPVESVFADFPEIKLDDFEERLCRNGLMPHGLKTPEGRFRAYSEKGEFLALCEAKNGETRIIKSFYEV